MSREYLGLGDGGGGLGGNLRCWGVVRMECGEKKISVRGVLGCLGGVWRGVGLYGWFVSGYRVW